MKHLPLILAIIVSAVGCASASDQDSISKTEQAETYCWGLPGPWFVIRPASQVDEVNRAKFLVDKLLNAMIRGRSWPDLIPVGPETCDYETCGPATCRGWTCTYYGTVDSTDGRLATQVIDEGPIAEAMADPLNTRLEPSERAELESFQAEASGDSAWYCFSY